MRPRQVHGREVVEARRGEAIAALEADAVVSTEPGLPVGVATADCVPILASSRDGRAVVAIHAGWRGLALGVVGAGIRALRARSSDADLIAVVGPSIGPCCYEVDGPVLAALRPRFASDLERALRPARSQHSLLDLTALVRVDLERSGVPANAIALLANSCTRCDSARFHSYRRDGSGAGRLLHFIASRRPRSSPPGAAAVRVRVDTDRGSP